MLEVENPRDLIAHVGEELGTSRWIDVDQTMIDAFAAVTGDHQWIHVDRERAAREMPDGKTIAHGFLTLSLLPTLAGPLLTVRNKGRGLNYGLNKVRFISPVKAGARIRIHQRLIAADPVDGDGVRFVCACTIEIEGSDRPAMAAETISINYPSA
ncbi:MAG: MaoC family dehydratase [Parvibaculum sp.]|uniref:MaoC family dehydratase n=1 Tax=Parvibaculum sp. TaxID=2024848 RepID=UPI003C708157